MFRINLSILISLILLRTLLDDFSMFEIEYNVEISSDKISKHFQKAKFYL